MVLAQKLSEEGRLKSLRALDILDSDPEPAFDALAELASQLLAAPMGLVTLIDQERQWIKAAHGVALRETERKHAFCSVAVERPDEVLIVPDAALDLRFRHNPLVTQHPKLRFYCGAPIITSEGAAIGAVCALDTSAHLMPSPEAIQGLRRLAAAASYMMESRRAAQQAGREARERRAAEARLEAALSDLRQVADARHRLVASMSRALRAALATMMTRLASARRKANEVSVARQLDQAVRSGLALRELVDDLIDIAQFDCGLAALVSEPVNVSTLVDGLQLAFADMASEKRLQLRVVNEAAGLEVESDRRRLRQMMAALLSNAIRGAQTDQIDLTLTHRAAGDDAVTLRFEVAVALEDEARLAAWRTLTYGRAPGDEAPTPLGLELARRLAQLMGGSIGLRPDKGRSILWFEVDAPLASARQAVVGEVEEFGDIIASDRKKVLIFAPDEAGKIQLEEAVRLLGWHYVVAADQTRLADLVDLADFDVALIAAGLVPIDRAALHALSLAADRAPIVALAEDAATRGLLANAIGIQIILGDAEPSALASALLEAVRARNIKPSCR